MSCIRNVAVCPGSVILALGMVLADPPERAAVALLSIRCLKKSFLRFVRLGEPSHRCGSTTPARAGSVISSKDEAARDRKAFGSRS
jgi:hypothetical protein